MTRDEAVEILMKAFEFEANLTSDRTLVIPSEVAAQLPQSQPMRVILLVNDSDEDEDWSRLTAEEFFKGYAEEDAIYDQLSAG